MTTSLKITSSALLLTVLLAACSQPASGPVAVTPTLPQPEVLTAAAVPVVSTDTDLGQTAVVSQRAQLEVQGLLSKSGLTPELYDVLSAFGLAGGLSGATLGTAATGLTSPMSVGRSLLSGVQGGRGLSAQGIVVAPVTLLPTGTYQVDAALRMTRLSDAPADGYVLNQIPRNLKVVAEWKVGGAATTTLTVAGFNPVTGVTSVQQEIPTSARATVSRLSDGQALAGATFGLTPGACLNLTGPDALKLNLWAGKVSAPELTASLDYAWTDKGLTYKLAGALKGKSKSMDAASSLDLKGSTANRCDPASFSFTPSKLDASASVTVPGDSLKADLKLRDLGNLVFSAKALQVPNPFARVEGKLRASAEHNGQAFFSAFGPLADGPDLDLIPGDGVEVKYVQNGALVTTNLQAFVASLASTLR